MMTVGCSNIPEKELAYRNSFKKTWDATMMQTEKTRKVIDKAYSEGDIETAAKEYLELGKYYASSREEIRRLNEPEGYGSLQKLALAYFSHGAAYYDSVGKIINDSGGNYNAEQEKTIKDKEDLWNKSTDSLRKALKAKRFALK